MELSSSGDLIFKTPTKSTKKFAKSETKNFQYLSSKALFDTDNDKQVSNYKSPTRNASQNPYQTPKKNKAVHEIVDLTNKDESFKVLKKSSETSAKKSLNLAFTPSKALAFDLNNLKMKEDDNKLMNEYSIKNVSIR